MRITNSKGFTIIELMIASSVFSIALLVCLGAVTYLGRLYYKGVTIANTSEVNRNVVDTLSEAVQYSGQQYISLPSASGWSGAYCIADKKYSYKLNTQLVEGSPGAGQSNDALVLSTDDICNSPVPIASSDRRELMKENMRLISLNVSAGAGSLINIESLVAYGGDPSSAGVDSDTFNFDGSGKIVSCKDTIRGSAFCSVSHLGTSVLRKVN